MGMQGGMGMVRLFILLPVSSLMLHHSQGQQGFGQQGMGGMQGMQGGMGMVRGSSFSLLIRYASRYRY